MLQIELHFVKDKPVVCCACANSSQILISPIIWWAQKVGVSIGRENFQQTASYPRREGFLWQLHMLRVFLQCLEILSVWVKAGCLNNLHENSLFGEWLLAFKRRYFLTSMTSIPVKITANSLSSFSTCLIQLRVPLIPRYRDYLFRCVWWTTWLQQMYVDLTLMYEAPGRAQSHALCYKHYIVWVGKTKVSWCDKPWCHFAVGYWITGFRHAAFCAPRLVRLAQMPELTLGQYKDSGQGSSSRKRLPEN